MGPEKCVAPSMGECREMTLRERLEFRAKQLRKAAAKLETLAEQYPTYLDGRQNETDSTLTALIGPGLQQFGSW